MTARRLRLSAAVAAAIVPGAILVHLGAEALSLGRSGLGIEFLVRHLYLGGLLAAALGVSASLLGVRSTAPERRRRLALARAELRRAATPGGILVLVAANLGFFALTQAGEGLPVLSGLLWLGLAAGLFGSLLAALSAGLLGTSAVAALQAFVAAVARRPARSVTAARRPLPLQRAAGRAFSLFVPNRPPPAGPSSNRTRSWEGTSSWSSPLAAFVAAHRSPPLYFSS